MSIKPGEHIQVLIAATADLQTVFTASADQIARLTRRTFRSTECRDAKSVRAAVLTGGAE